MQEFKSKNPKTHFCLFSELSREQIASLRLQEIEKIYKKGESLLASTPVVVLSAILGRTPTLEEYKAAVKGIKLTQFAPPLKKMTTNPMDDHKISY